jgi:hypothetical protein
MSQLAALQLLDLHHDVVVHVLRRLRCFRNVRGVCRLLEAHIKRCVPLLEATYALNSNKFMLDANRAGKPAALAEIQLPRRSTASRASRCAACATTCSG